MKNRFIISYTLGDSMLHKLNGTTKILGFVAITVFIIMTFDVRLLIPMFLLCLIGIATMKPRWRIVLFMWGFLTVTAGLIGSIFMILIRPGAGYTLVGGQNTFFFINERFFLSWEMLWYVGIVYFKRVCSLASAVLFIVAITPSELASGMNRLGMPYKICVVFSLAFRTIPDIARDYENIRNSLMMRGIELDSRKAKLSKRLKQTVFMLIPLIITAFGKVSHIAAAMDLRGFGKHKKRSWYSEKEPTRADWIARVIIFGLMIFCAYYIAFHRIINPPPFDYWAPWIDAG